jgi:putative transposase
MYPAGAKNYSLTGAVLDCGLDEIRRQLQYKAAMRGGRVRSCGGCLTGPKGREDMHVEHWICSECGAEHERDAGSG